MLHIAAIWFVLFLVLAAIFILKPLVFLEVLNRAWWLFTGKEMAFGKTASRWVRIGFIIASVIVAFGLYTVFQMI